MSNEARMPSARWGAIAATAALAAIALAACFLCSCSNGGPVKLLGANYFKYASGGYASAAQPYLCVNWLNQGTKPVDYMEVDVMCLDEHGEPLSEEDRDVFSIRIMEGQGVEPGKKNSQNLVKSPFKFDSEPAKVLIKVNRVSFSDGSTWVSESDDYQEFRAGANATGYIPAVIDEVSFYKSSPQAVDRFINIDWHNRSTTATTLAVEFKITGSGSSNGSDEPNPVTYLTLSDQVSPGDENHAWKSKFASNFLGEDAIKGASEYTICVHRVIDTEGNIWVNDGDSGSITATFVGKKGCAFGSYSQYAQVAKTVKEIHSSLAASGVETEDPLVFVKPGSHCVIRYPDLDITMEVDAAGEVIDDWAVFNLYYKEADAKWDIILPKSEKIGSAVFPAILTSMPSDDVISSWADYCNNDSAAPQFPDSSFLYKEDFGGIYEDYNRGSVIGVMRVCVAKDLTGAFDHDWAKRYPY